MIDLLKDDGSGQAMYFLYYCHAGFRPFINKGRNIFMISIFPLKLILIVNLTNLLWSF